MPLYVMTSGSSFRVFEHELWFNESLPTEVVKTLSGLRDGRTGYEPSHGSLTDTMTDLELQEFLLRHGDGS